MRGTADRDFSAFHEIDLRLTGLHPNVVSAAQHRFDLAMHELDAHRSLQCDGIAFDRADRVASRFVAVCPLRARRQQFAGVRCCCARICSVDAVVAGRFASASFAAPASW